MLDRLFRVSGCDENNDVHAFYTNNRARAEELCRQMGEKLQRIKLIEGFVVTVGISAAQHWEYHETVELACERARYLEGRGGKQVSVEDSEGRSVAWQ